MSSTASSDYLKIYLFAHDHLIMTTNFVDWIGVIKNLLEEKEFDLIMRSLRYLKFKEEDNILESISLLLINTLNKVKNISIICVYINYHIYICMYVCLYVDDIRF